MSGHKFLRLAQVKERIGLSSPSIYRLISAEKFPAPVRIGPNSSVWIESEIDAWSEKRVAERDDRLAAQQRAAWPCQISQG